MPKSGSGAAKNGHPGGDLSRLAEGIRDALTRADVADGERLEWYRAAGAKLIEAKRLYGPHGKWGKWLRENCELTERRAQKYMAFSKTPPGADLKGQQEQWRQV
jgi:hypothetical protein